MAVFEIQLLSTVIRSARVKMESHKLEKLFPLVCNFQFAGREIIYLIRGESLIFY